MKITAAQYAKLLYGLTADKSQAEADVSVANFFRFLAKNRQTKLLLKIVGIFSGIWNKEKGMVDVEVASARKLEVSELRKIEERLKEKYPSKKAVLANIVDEKIIGGIVIRIKDEITDGSISRTLSDLKKKMES